MMAFAVALSAQTAIDQTQLKNVDFADKPYTRPNKTGAALPSSCRQGETFFLTTAVAGRNLYLCGSSNTWSQVSGTGGGIGSLNGQTGSTQTFQNDSNVVITSGSDSHTLGWQGTLPVTRGGTGASASSGARVNLLPSYGGNANKCLTLNSSATDAVWTTCSAGGISSLNGLTNSTQTFVNDSNLAISSAGSSHTLQWTGLLPIARGGTGAASVSDARQRLLPAYSGNTGKCLAVNSSATDILWTDCGSAGSTYTAGAGIDITGSVISVSSAAVQHLFGSASLDFPSISQAACADLTLSLPGASTGDTLAAGWPASLPSGVSGSMFVSSANVVVVRMCNLSGSAVDLPILGYSARILRSF
jgi:hypothetical protein